MAELIEQMHILMFVCMGAVFVAYTIYGISEIFKDMFSRTKEK